MSSRPLRIGIVAGEPSGDVLAAGMLKAIKAQYPDAIIEGIGGQHMQAQGCRSLFDMEALSVMGLVEVLKDLRKILAIKKQLVSYFTEFPPDVFIGVDAPDFNLRVEAELKAKGIKTIHYVSPTVWAWREKRIHKIAKATNLVLGIFPFESQVYAKYNVPFAYVGHTMADIIPLQPNQADARAQLNLPAEKPILAVLPGSRRGEVANLLPVFMPTCERIITQIPECQIIIPAANAQRYTFIDEYLKQHYPHWLNEGRVHLYQGQSREVMIASDVILLASGTATLEAMLCKRPMVAAYKLAPMTHFLMRFLYKPDYFSLPNILANKPLIPELLQEQVNPDFLAETLLPLFNQDTSELIEQFTELHAVLKRDADSQAAQKVLEIINDTTCRGG